MDLSDYITRTKICFQEKNLHRLKKIILPGYKCLDSYRRGSNVPIFVEGFITHFPFPTIC